MPTDYVASEHHEFLAATDQALANPRLQEIITVLGDRLGGQNRKAWAELPDSSLVRERARAIKDATLAELDKHLETLDASVVRNGGHVYWAENGVDAAQTVLDILRRAQATR